MISLSSIYYIYNNFLTKMKKMIKKKKSDSLDFREKREETCVNRTEDIY